MQQDNIKCALHIVHNVDHRRLLSCWCWCRTPRDPQPAQHHLTPPRAAGALVTVLELLYTLLLWLFCLHLYHFSQIYWCLKIISKFIKLLFESYSDTWFNFLMSLFFLFWFYSCNCCEYIWRRNAPLAKDRDWPPYLLSSSAGCRVTTTGARWGLLSHLGHSTQWWLMSWPAALCLQMSWTGA